MAVFGQKCLYSGMAVILEQSACIWAIVVVFGQNGYICAKKVVFGKEVVAFAQSGCIRGKVVVPEQ